MCGKEPVYAIVVISNVFENAGAVMNMIDNVAKVADKKARVQVIQHLKKLSWPLGDSEDEPSRRSSRAFSPSAQTTPYTVREARRLSLHPTDASLPSPSRD